ncbi:MAG: tetratricopeptide repeat protein [Gemmataceae bacterium]
MVRREQYGPPVGRRDRPGGPATGRAPRGARRRHDRRGGNRRPWRPCWSKRQTCRSRAAGRSRGRCSRERPACWPTRPRRTSASARARRKGLAEYRQGRAAQAVPLRRESAALLPNRAGPRLALAMALFQSGSPKEARQTLAAAVRAYNWQEARADHTTLWVSHVLRHEAEALILPNPPPFRTASRNPGTTASGRPCWRPGNTGAGAGPGSCRRGGRHEAARPVAHPWAAVATHLPRWPPRTRPLRRNPTTAEPLLDSKESR